MQAKIFQNSREILRLRGRAEIGGEIAKNRPFLHRLFEKNGRVVLFCSTSRKTFAMDHEAFDAFGETFLAKNSTKPFAEGGGFKYFAPVVTSKCNMGCTYCFGAEKNRKGKNASIEMLKKAVDFIAEKKQPVWVTFFSAGEQVGDFRAFKETLDYAVEKLEIEKIKMSTNGTGNPQDYLGVVDRIKSFQVSFDGPPEIQDLQRPLKGGLKSSPMLEKTVK
ncbi:MAG: radical SAM protein, partial [Candidatus Diapherotrites archaeon]